MRNTRKIKCFSNEKPLVALVLNPIIGQKIIQVNSSIIIKQYSQVITSHSDSFKVHDGDWD